MIDRRALLASLSAAALIGPRPAFAATVKDAAGRAVRTLADEAFAEAGPHHLEVDGCDSHGARLPAGIYFYRVRSADGPSTGRFVIAH